MIVSGSDDGTVRVWNERRERVQIRLGSAVTGVATLGTAQLVASGPFGLACLTLDLSVHEYKPATGSL